MLQLVTFDVLFQYTYQTHCVVSNAKNLVTAKMFAGEERPVPHVVRSATPTLIALVSPSVRFALAVTLFSNSHFGQFLLKAES